MRATIVLFEIKHQNGRQRRVRGKKIMRKTSQPPAVLFLVPVSSCPSLCLWGLPGGGRSHSGPLPRMATERPLPSRWLESNGLIQGPLTLRSSPRKPGGTQLGCVQLWIFWVHPKMDLFQKIKLHFWLAFRLIVWGVVFPDIPPNPLLGRNT